MGIGESSTAYRRSDTEVEAVPGLERVKCLTAAISRRASLNWGKRRRVGAVSAVPVGRGH